MNEKRFIQLINLYIDREITPEELEELENEVARDPRRREIYQSYCRLQQASQVVYRRFGDALAEAVDLKKYQILARDSSRCVRRGVMYSMGALAAACITVVAAIAVFQEPEWERAGIRPLEQSVHGSVEVFEPAAVNSRNARSQFASASQSEPFFFGGRNPARQQRKTGFFESAPFHSSRAQAWEESFSADSSAAIIRGDASFDVTADFASFQFQR